MDFLKASKIGANPTSRRMDAEKKRSLLLVLIMRSSFVDRTYNILLPDLIEFIVVTGKKLSLTLPWLIPCRNL